MTGAATRQPLRTARLELRPVGPEHEADFVAFYGDPEVMAIRRYGVMAPDVAAAQHAKLMAHWAKHGFGMYAVLVDGVFAGECGLRWRDDRPEVEVSYGLLPAFRGKGYATEAARAVMAFGFETLKRQQIVAYSRSDNLVSHRVLEKLGMTFRAFHPRGQGGIESQEGVVSYVKDAP
ncbi:MAG: GNAT family N-acetyltransferase [Alphaproteobacteria bacterium]